MTGILTTAELPILLHKDSCFCGILRRADS